MITDPKIRYLLSHYDDIIKSYNIIYSIGAGLAAPFDKSGFLSGEVTIPLYILKKYKEQRDEIPLRKATFLKKFNDYCQNQNMSNYRLAVESYVSPSTITRICSMDKSGYQPKRETIFCICLALDLSFEETQEMLLYSCCPDDNSKAEILINWYLQEKDKERSSPSYTRLSGREQIEGLDICIYEATGQYYLAPDSYKNRNYQNS